MFDNVGLEILQHEQRDTACQNELLSHRHQHISFCDTNIAEFSQVDPLDHEYDHFHLATIFSDGKLSVAINHLILSHVYSSRNTSKETQLNTFFNLPPRSVPLFI